MASYLDTLPNAEDQGTGGALVSPASTAPASGTPGSAPSYLLSMPDAADQSAPGLATKKPIATIPEPIGAGPNGEPIWDDSTPEGAAANREAREAERPVAEQTALAGLAFLTGGAAAPAEAALVAAAPRLIAPLVRPVFQTGVGSFIGGASAGIEDALHGKTDTIGSDVVHGAETGGVLGAAGWGLGKVIGGAYDLGRRALSPLLSSSGKDVVAGTVLKEATQSPNPTYATSPIQNLNLRTPQATGDRGLAELERTIAPPGVQNGKTSEQVDTVLHSLVGDDAGIQPAVLTGRASKAGVDAVNGVDTALGNAERQLWSTPSLSTVKLNGGDIASGTTADVAQFPASWRDAVTGPQGRLGAYLRELQDLGPDASIADVNSVISRLRRAGRDASSGATPDAVTAAAANRMADSILDRMALDPAIAGRPAGQTQLTGYWSGRPIGAPTPVPAVPANPAAWSDFQAARNFTRQKNQTLGFNEFDQILNPNSAGNIQGNPETMFGRFFDATNGTATGLLRIQNAIELARKSGATAAAQQLEDAANQYVRAAIVRTARAGNGFDAAGQPAMNMATLASTGEKTSPALREATITGGPMGPYPPGTTVQDVESAGEAAKLLNRPAASRGDFNSTTYEKLKNNDLISAIARMHTGGTIGAMTGGYAGYKYGPEAMPFYIRVPLGMLAGGVAGSAGAVATNPIIKAFTKGPTDQILQRIRDGLASPAEYRRLLQSQILPSTRIGPTIERATQTLTPSIAAPSPGPSINPDTGQPQFNLKSAQQDAADDHAEKIVRAIYGLDATETKQWLDQNKEELRKRFGGQGINRVMQVSALMRRAEGTNPAATLYSLVAANPTPAIQKAGGDMLKLTAKAIVNPKLAQVLATRTTQRNIPRAGEAQVLAALAQHGE